MAMSEDCNPVQWVTTTEAAELTGYTADYFRKAIKRGLLHGRKRGRDWFLSKDEVVAYAEEMEKLGPTKHDPRRTGRNAETTRESEPLCPRSPA
jgi:excisionase family DNA binding protein